MIPEIDAQCLANRDEKVLQAIRYAVEHIGFFTLSNTLISTDEVNDTLAMYQQFFHGPKAMKQSVDMAETGANRGWGGSKSEQVNPNSNPDYKEIFDCGVQVAPNDPQAQLSVYAPNLWPSKPDNFQYIIEKYFVKARQVAFNLLQGIATALEKDATFFDDKFNKPMALLRGNYYPKRPDNATSKDFGIAEHTDYGCLTLLATDGQPGLEAKMPDGRWVPILANPGTFVINFGEMLEMWTDGKILATPHRVKGGKQERLSIPLFFNPDYDTNVAAPHTTPISAGDYLSKRYAQTYTHLQKPV